MNVTIFIKMRLQRFLSWVSTAVGWRAILTQEFCRSVLPSVRHAPVLYRNGYHHTFFSAL